MRSPTGTVPAFGRVSPECRLSFHRPLRAVELLPPGAPAPESKVIPRPAPQPAAPPVAPPAAAPAAAPVAERPQQPDPEREAALAAERAAERARLVAALDEVRAAVADLRTQRAAQVADLQRVAVEMAAAIAARLLHDTVTAGEFPIDAKVRDMIAQLGDDEPVRVLLHPADLQLLKQRLGDAPLQGDRADPRFVADPELARGGCRVEGRESVLVSDVARELEDIREDLLRSLGNAGS